MSQKSIKGSATLAKRIKARRNELGLTIEEAAAKASVGTKTWCRYEAGESIRADKYRGVCRALNWSAFPAEEGDEEPEFDLESYRQDQTWPKDIEAKFGTKAALSFVAGSELLLDYLCEEMDELSRLPVGSHIGQLDFSIIVEMLPPQFLMRYDYDFLYALKCTVKLLCMTAQWNHEIIAHSIMEELAIYCIVESSEWLMEDIDLGDDDDYWKEWIYDLFGDSDIIMYLYSNAYLEKDHPFYFDCWMEKQFWMN